MCVYIYIYTMSNPIKIHFKGVDRSHIKCDLYNAAGTGFLNKLDI